MNHWHRKLPLYFIPGIRNEIIIIIKKNGGIQASAGESNCKPRAVIQTADSRMNGFNGCWLHFLFISASSAYYFFSELAPQIWLTSDLLLNPFMQGSQNLFPWTSSWSCFSLHATFASVFLLEKIELVLKISFEYWIWQGFSHESR